MRRTKKSCVILFVCLAAGAYASCTSEGLCHSNGPSATSWPPPEWPCPDSPPFAPLVARLPVSLLPSGPILAAEGSNVTLTCSTPHHLDSIPVVYAWEKVQNGRRDIVLRDTRDLDFELTAETEGVYRCVVNLTSQTDYPITNVSLGVVVEIPRFDGWLDTVTPPPQTFSPTPSTTTTTTTTETVNKELPLGGFAILECRPNTTDPSNFTVTWLKNDVVVRSDSEHRVLNAWTLLVNSSSQGAGPSGGKMVRYECIVAGLQYLHAPIRRTFNLTQTTDSGMGWSLLPADQIVPSGSDITLYCFTLSKSQSQSNVTWYRRQGGRRESVSSGPISEVLTVRGVTETAVYSCSDGSGLMYNATVTVVMQPNSVDILTVFPKLSNDVIINGSSSSLTCLASPHVGMSYLWYYKGHPVASESGPVMAAGNVLRVAGGVTGFVQCVASGIAGSASSQAYYLTTKPRPPKNLTDDYSKLYRNTNNCVEHRLAFYPPHDYPITGYSYEVDVWMHREHNAQYNSYTCRTDLDVDDGSGSLNVPVESYADENINYYVVTRVHLVFGGVMSAPRYFRTNNGSCVIPVLLDTINETFLHTEDIEYTQIDPEHWNASLKWTEPKSVQTGFLPFCEVRVQCGGRTIPSIEDDSGISHPSVRYTATGIGSCEKCQWIVTYKQYGAGLEQYNLINSPYFTSKPIVPNEPPHISQVHRVGDDGISVEITFTIPDEEVCAITAFDVEYSSSSSGHTHSIAQLLNSTHCSNSTPSHTYSCTVQLIDADCWQPYSISVRYRNGAETASPSSNIWNLTQPDPRTFSQLFTNLTASETTFNSSSLTYQLSPSLSCLLERHHLQVKVQICWRQLSEEGVVPTGCSIELCRPMEFENEFDHGTWNSDTLIGDTLYQFVPEVTYTFGSGPPVQICDWQASVEVHTPEGVPTAPPTDVTFRMSNESKGSNFIISWSPPPPTEQNGNITHYLVNLESGLEGNQSTRIVPADQGDLSFSEVYDPALEYSYSVAACTSVGCGPFSERGHYSASSGAEIKVEIVASVVAAVVAAIIAALISILILCLVRKHCRRSKRNLQHEDISRLMNNEVEDGQSDIVDISSPANYYPPSVVTEQNDLVHMNDESDERVRQWVADGCSGEAFEEEEREGGQRKEDVMEGELEEQYGSRDNLLPRIESRRENNGTLTPEKKKKEKRHSNKKSKKTKKPRRVKAEDQRPLLSREDSSSLDDLPSHTTTVTVHKEASWEPVGKHGGFPTLPDSSVQTKPLLSANRQTSSSLTPLQPSLTQNQNSPTKSSKIFSDVHAHPSFQVSKTISSGYVREDHGTDLASGSTPPLSVCHHQPTLQCQSFHLPVGGFDTSSSGYATASPNPNSHSQPFNFPTANSAPSHNSTSSKGVVDNERHNMNSGTSSGYTTGSNPPSEEQRTSNCSSGYTTASAISEGDMKHDIEFSLAHPTQTFRTTVDCTSPYLPKEFTSVLVDEDMRVEQTSPNASTLSSLVNSDTFEMVALSNDVCALPGQDTFSSHEKTLSQVDFTEKDIDSSSETGSSVFLVDTSVCATDNSRHNVASRSSYGSMNLGDLSPYLAARSSPLSSQRRESEGYKSMVTSPQSVGNEEVKFQFPDVGQENSHERDGLDRTKHMMFTETSSTRYKKFPCTDDDLLRRSAGYMNISPDVVKVNFNMPS